MKIWNGITRFVSQQPIALQLLSIKKTAADSSTAVPFIFRDNYLIPSFFLISFGRASL